MSVNALRIIQRGTKKKRKIKGGTGQNIGKNEKTEDEYNALGTKITIVKVVYVLGCWK